MTRASSSDIEEIIEVDSSIILDPFIQIANELVTELCSDSGYSDDRLKLIEIWLSAHFYAVRDPRTKSEGVSGMSETYEGQTTQGLSFTRYGQQAMLLDTAGALANLNANTNKAEAGKKVLKITYLGE